MPGRLGVDVLPFSDTSSGSDSKLFNRGGKATLELISNLALLSPMLMANSEGNA